MFSIYILISLALVFATVAQAEFSVWLSMYQCAVLLPTWDAHIETRVWIDLNVNGKHTKFDQRFVDRTMRETINEGSQYLVQDGVHLEWDCWEEGMCRFTTSNEVKECKFYQYKKKGICTSEDWYLDCHV